MTRKQKRMAVLVGGVGFVMAAVLLVLFAFSQSVAYFFMPGDLKTAQISPGARIRLGGLVEMGSVRRDGGSTVTFAVTDGKDTVPVTYTGILPDLFREGQGVVTEGAFDAATHAFAADTVLAKHDENYMPKEVADRLKREGVWEDGSGKGMAPAGAAPGQAAPAQAAPSGDASGREAEGTASEATAGGGVRP